MTPYIISGLVAGSITAISALGLLLTYKSSRVFNFAHGAIAYSIAIFYYYLTRRNGWSIEIAAPFTILIVAPLMGLFLYFALFRRLTHATPTVRLVSTVGLWVALPAVIRILFPFSTEDVFQPEGLDQFARPTRTSSRCSARYMNTNQVAVIVSALVIVDRHLARPPFHADRSGHAGDRRSPPERGDRGREHRRGHGRFVDGRHHARRLRGRAPRAHPRPPGVPVHAAARRVVRRRRDRPHVEPAAHVRRCDRHRIAAADSGSSTSPTTGLFSVGVAASIPFAVMLVFLIYYSFTSSGLRRESFEIDRRIGGGVHGDAAPLPPAHGLRR